MATLLAGSSEANAASVTWIGVKYQMTAGWSGPEFLGYTNPEETRSYDGPTQSGVNEAIGLTGLATASWNLNLYSFSSAGPGQNMGAMFSNMGFFYNPPDSPWRHFKFRIHAELVFKIDRAANFSHAGIHLLENIGPFRTLKLEAGTVIGTTFSPSATLIDSMTPSATAYLVPGAYRFTFAVDQEWDTNVGFGRGNNVVWQVTEASNQPPVAIDDYYVMDQLETLNQGTPGILVNDSDPDNNALTVELIVGPINHSAFQLNVDGSFSYTPIPFFYGSETFTYRVFDGTAYSEPATVHITVRQPGSTGHITGGGNFSQDGTKRTFGFQAKVKPTGAQGNLEFLDHALGLNVKSTGVTWVYTPNSQDGYFSGTCLKNGQSGYTFFVEVHDRGEPGTSDSFSMWVFNSNNVLVYSTSGSLSTGGNIQIH